MSDRKFVYKIIKDIEEKFDCICYAFNSSEEGRPFWNICVDDYDLYRSEYFNKVASEWYNKQRKLKNLFLIVFCYCNPLEEKLYKYAQSDNLIMKI